MTDEQMLEIIIADYADLKLKPSLLKIAAIKEIHKREAQLYNKWLGTFMEPVLRDEIACLQRLLD